MSKYDEWLAAKGIVRGHETAMDEILWLREERNRLRLTSKEQESIHRFWKWASDIARDSAFTDEVCEAASDAANAIGSFVERHK